LNESCELLYVCALASHEDRFSQAVTDRPVQCHATEPSRCQVKLDGKISVRPHPALPQVVIERRFVDVNDAFVRVQQPSQEQPVRLTLNAELAISSALGHVD